MSTIYLGTIDAGGEPYNLLLSAINTRLGKSYTLNEFDFGEPEAVTTPSPTHNTKIKFGPKMSAGYYGVRTIYYNRIHASELGNVIIAYNGETSVSQLLTKINEKYGILIKFSDIVDGPVAAPTVGLNQVQVALTFKPNSIIYYSSTQIQVGLNDPTGDQAPTVSFENYATFAFDQGTKFNLLGNTYTAVEPFSMALGRDNVSLRLSTLTSAIQGNGVGAHTRLRLPQATYDTVRSNLPFVGQWIVSISGKARGITVMGDIYELSLDGLDWTFIENGLDISSTNVAAVADSYTTPYVKMAIQDNLGNVYVLAKKPGDTPAIWKIATGTNIWTKLAFAITRMQCLTPALWASIKIVDALHSNDRLWILVKSETLYATHPSKSRETPAVEMFNTTTVTTDYFPLGETNARFSGISLTTNGGKWRLVTPPSSSAANHCDVVALLNSDINDNTYAVIYRHQAVGEYLAYILPSSLLPSGSAVEEEMDICGFQTVLTTTTADMNSTPITGHYLDSIVILCPTEDDNFNRYFLRTGIRGPRKYRGTGVKVLTSVAVRGGRTPWVETPLNLTSANKPVFVTLNGAGKRNTVLFQNGVAIHKFAFSQQVGTADFTAILNSTTVLNHHTGFDGVSPTGSCVWVKPSVIESATPSAMLSTIQDDESAMSPIGFSFITKKDNGDKYWYTAQLSTDLLSLRKPSFNYAFMGETPAVVLAEGNRLLYWSDRGNGLFISTNTGASWQEFKSAPFFYKQEAAPSAALNVLGSSVLTLTSENFGEAAFVADKVLIETRCDEEFLVYDNNNGQANAVRQVADQMLFEINKTGPNTYSNSGVQTGFGFNVLSNHSPRKILAWDSDSNGIFETVGKASSSAATPYDTDHRVSDYMLNTPGRLVDFSRDVRYLGYRHWFLVEHQNVWKLHFTNIVEPSKTIGMFGDTTSPYSTFLPEVNFHLWDYVDAVSSYVPYIFYASSRIILLERIDNNNEFADTYHVLDIPGDNGLPLVPVKMYTANRRDYWFHQKGNGIFKLTYEWDGITSTSTLGLEKMFDMTSFTLAALTVTSGAIGGVSAQSAPMEPLLPDALPVDTIIGVYCVGTTLMHRKADGMGGYIDTPELYSYDCNFIAESDPMPAQGGAGGGG